MTDQQLVSQFVSKRGEPAFTELVRRYIDLVYSAARRQVNDPADAEDVTQSVFVLLAQRANTLRRSQVIAGWLLTTTRNVALNTLRARSRRLHHEHEAAAMNQEARANSSPDAQWQTARPILDEAVAQLRPRERDALTLRFFQNLGVPDVADALGISQAAAQRRIHRAVARLRKLFAAQGISTPSAAIDSLLSTCVLARAPAALAPHAVRTALASAGPAAVGAAAGASALATTVKAKWIVASVVVLLLGVVGGTVAFKTYQRASQPVSGGATAAATVPADAVGRFETAYALKPDELVKRIPPPFTPERLEYYRVKLERPVRNYPNGPGAWFFSWDGAALDWRDMNYGRNTVRDVLKAGADLWPQDCELSLKVLDQQVLGDWVVRTGAQQQAKAIALSQALADVFGPGTVLKPELVEREVIVARGNYHFVPLPDKRIERVHFFRGAVANSAGGWNGRGELLRWLGESLDIPVIADEAKIPSTEPAEWTIDKSADFRHSAAPPDAVSIDEILANVARQTSLELKRERRAVTVWRLEPL